MPFLPILEKKQKSGLFDCIIKSGEILERLEKESEGHRQSLRGLNSGSTADSIQNVLISRIWMLFENSGKSTLRCNNDCCIVGLFVDTVNARVMQPD